MGFLDVVKIILLPGLIAACIYFLLAYLLVPLMRRHQGQYNQYVPSYLQAQRRQSLRDRVSQTFQAAVLARRFSTGTADPGMMEDEDLVFGDEDGEQMVGFDVNNRDDDRHSPRPTAMGFRMPTFVGGFGASGRRGRREIVDEEEMGSSSREIEEGPKDDEDSEDEGLSPHGGR